jgi:hypothetical protein
MAAHCNIVWWQPTATLTIYNLLYFFSFGNKLLVLLPDQPYSDFLAWQWIYMLLGPLTLLQTKLHCTLSWHVPWGYWGLQYTALCPDRFFDGTEGHTPLHFILTGSLMVLRTTMHCTLPWQVLQWYWGPHATVLCPDRFSDFIKNYNAMYFVLTGFHKQLQ